MTRGRPHGCSLGLTGVRVRVLRLCGGHMKVTEIARKLGHKGHGHAVNTIRWLKSRGYLDKSRKLTLMGFYAVEIADEQRATEAARAKI